MNIGNLGGINWKTRVMTKPLFVTFQVPVIAIDGIVDRP